jgi:NDP-sugar pyrophosphorylase family protein
MQVIILAAGIGIRLRPITYEVPKVMAKIRNKELILYQLESISKIKNISEIIIVVGYKREKIKKLVGDRYKGIKIRYVDNIEYKTTNNIYSLYLALPYITEELLLMEGDIIFKPKLLKKVKRRRDTVFIEKYKPYMDGTIVEINENTKVIQRLIPKREQGNFFDASSYYKTINIYHFTFKFIKEVYKPVLDLYISKFGKKDYYELIIGALVYLNVCCVYAEVIKDEMMWFEVDDIDDLKFAENVLSRT